MVKQKKSNSLKKKNENININSSLNITNDNNTNDIIHDNKTIDNTSLTTLIQLSVENELKEIEESIDINDNCIPNDNSNDVNIYFKTLMKNLDIPFHDIERMQLTNDEKWNLIQSYNQISVPKQSKIISIPNQIEEIKDITLNNQLEMYEKKNLKLLKLLSNKKKNKQIGPTLQQISSIQYIQCIHILLLEKKPKALHDSKSKVKVSKLKLNIKDKDYQDPLLILYQGLRVCLSSKHVKWLRDFILYGGVKYLLSTLSYINSCSSPSFNYPQIQYEVLKCLKISLNYSLGIGILLEDEIQTRICIEQIVFGLFSSISSSKAISAKLLAVFSSLGRDYNDILLQGLLKLSKLRKEPSQYFQIITCINQDTSIEVKLNCLVLLNTIIYNLIDDKKIKTLQELNKLGIESSLLLLQQTYTNHNQKNIKQLYTQINRFKDLQQDSIFNDNNSTTSTIEYNNISNDLLQSSYPHLLSNNNTNNDEYYELQKAYYYLYNENQELRKVKEQSIKELSSLHSELDNIKDSILSLNTYSNTSCNIKRLPSCKSAQQSLTNIVMQFNDNFNDSSTNIYSDNSIESWKVKYEQLESINTILQEKQTSIESKLSTIQQEKQIIDDKNEYLMNKNNELNQVIDSLKTSYSLQRENIDIKVNTLTEEKSQLSQENIVLKNTITSLESSLNTNNTLLYSYKDKISKKDVEIEQLYNQISLSQKQVQILQDKIKSLESQYSNNKIDISKNTIHIHNLNKQIKEKESQIQLYQDNEKILKQSYNDKENTYLSDINTLNNNLLKEKERLKQIQLFNNELEKKYKDLQEQNNNNKNINKELQEQLDYYNTQITIKDNQIQRILKEEKEPLEYEYTELQISYSKLNHLNDKLSTEIHSISKLYDILDERYNEINIKYTNQCILLNETISLKEELQLNNTSLENHIKELENENNLLNISLNDISSKLSYNINEKKELHILKQEFNIKLEELNKQLENISNERNHINTQNTNIQELFNSINNEKKVLKEHQKQLEEEQKQFKEEKQEFIIYSNTLKQDIELEQNNLNTQLETYNIQLNNFENAKNQFNIEISHFLKSKKEHEVLIDSKLSNTQQQLNDLEVSIYKFNQEKEAFACFQSNERKNIKEEKHANEKAVEIINNQKELLEKQQEQLQKDLEEFKKQKEDFEKILQEQQKEKEEQVLKETIKENTCCSNIPPSLPNNNGNIPLPPPPMVAIKLPEPEGCNIKPSIKVKALNWKKIAPISYEKSLWKSIESPNVILPKDELEELFKVKTVKNNNTKQSSKLSNNITTLIEPRRAQNIAILLSSCKISVENIQNSIENMNYNELDESLLLKIQKLLPTNDEIELIQTSIQLNPSIILGPAEQFFLQLSNIPQFNERIQLLCLLKSYPIKYNHLNNTINDIKVLLNKIKDFSYFPKVLKVILHFGNFFNNGTSRGHANGFKLSSLDCLLQMRTSKSLPTQKTLLHVFSSYMGESFPLLESGFLDELSIISKICETKSFNDIQKNIKDLYNELTNGKSIYQDIISTNSNDLSNIESFISLSLQDINNLEQLYNNIQVVLQDLCYYYGFNGNETSLMKLDTFLHLFSNFYTCYINIKKDILKYQIQQEATLKREIAAKERKERMEKKKEERLKLKQQKEQNLVDNVFENLCGGNYNTIRKSKNKSSKSRFNNQKNNSLSINNENLSNEISDIWNTCQTKTNRTKKRKRVTPINNTHKKEILIE